MKYYSVSISAFCSSKDHKLRISDIVLRNYSAQFASPGKSNNTSNHIINISELYHHGLNQL